MSGRRIPSARPEPENSERSESPEPTRVPECPRRPSSPERKLAVRPTEFRAESGFSEPTRIFRKPETRMSSPEFVKEVQPVVVMQSFVTKINVHWFKKSSILPLFQAIYYEMIYLAQTDIGDGA